MFFDMIWINLSLRVNNTGHITYYNIKKLERNRKKREEKNIPKCRSTKRMDR